MRRRCIQRLGEVKLSWIKEQYHPSCRCCRTNNCFNYSYSIICLFSRLVPTPPPPSSPLSVSKLPSDTSPECFAPGSKASVTLTEEGDKERLPAWKTAWWRQSGAGERLLAWVCKLRRWKFAGVFDGEHLWVRWGELHGWGRTERTCFHAQTYSHCLRRGILSMQIADDSLERAANIECLTTSDFVIWF